ncbi:hypothetical protein [Kitasatospora sp. NPDC057198]|uniref:hypothetical protein n=1 Tax=Kitasatospora sp. NPDC057198 TaxID=3346046 RepID=UPI0036347EFE
MDLTTTAGPPASFALVVGLLTLTLTLTPGLDTALVLRTAVIAFVRTLRARLRRPSVRRLLDRATGVAVLGFGAKPAFTD